MSREAQKNNFAATVVAQTLKFAASRLISALRDAGCRSPRGSRRVSGILRSDPVYWRRRGIRLRHLTLFELSDFKNSLKSLASAGVAIEGPSQKFERPQPLLDWPGQPVLHRIVRIGQTHDGKLRAVQPELLEPVLSHGFSLPPAQARFAALSEWLTILPE